MDYLTKLKNDLSVNGKNGISFLLSACIIWSIITIIFLLPLDIDTKNMFMLFTTGIMFPLSVAMSTIIKADWKFENNPLGSLGLFLNLAQLIYFPILLWTIVHNPNQMVLFFAIITGAHFFPYGWLYNSKPFYFMAPIISLGILLIGWFINTEALWIIPFSMIILFLTLILWLIKDYKSKEKLIRPTKAA